MDCFGRFRIKILEFFSRYGPSVGNFNLVTEFWQKQVEELFKTKTRNGKDDQMCVSCSSEYKEKHTILVHHDKQVGNTRIYRIMNSIWTMKTQTLCAKKPNTNHFKNSNNLNQSFYLMFYFDDFSF
jgi:hypothetical protein